MANKEKEQRFSEQSIRQLLTEEYKQFNLLIKIATNSKEDLIKVEKSVNGFIAKLNDFKL